MPVSYPSTLQWVDTTTTLIANVNSNRTGLIICATNSDVWVKLGPQGTFTNYTYFLPRKGILEVDGYRGVVTAVCSVLSQVNLTEAS